MKSDDLLDENHSQVSWQVKPNLVNEEIKLDFQVEKRGTHSKDTGSQALLQVIEAEPVLAKAEL